MGILRRDTGIPVHQLLDLSWEDFLTEAVCTFQLEEDLAWELKNGPGNANTQKTLDVARLAGLTALV